MKKLGFATLLASGALTLASAPATAQTAPAAAAAPTKPVPVSDQVRPSLIALQTAVNAKNYAAVPGLIAAANAKAKTSNDRYLIAQMQLKAAVDQNDFSTAASAVATMRASGAGTPAQLDQFDLAIAQSLYNAKNYAAAAPVLERLTQSNPNNTDVYLVLAETRNAQGQPAQAIATLQRAMAVRTAAGQPVPQEWYKRGIAFAYNGKLPTASALAYDWVKAYPSTDSWRDSLRIFEQLSPASASDKLDLYRLRRAAGVLDSENEYAGYAQLATDRGLPGETVAVINDGYAKGKINRGNAAIRSLLTSAQGRVTTDKASLPGLETRAAAAASGRPLLNTADAYFGYGDYGKAATLYRRALTKPDVDKNVANLRLGIALAQSGDKAGAQAAFAAVTGPTADLAKYWQLWANRAA
ncbi:tetratricopeptide repeat protein [Sphingomonas ginkgonis]|uniref:Tetratricopeptide repeat protein n=1 Tax=Sphingomonas ginkgonis TaxID=2315330 RepID=A0A429VB13_9SPHN|nr:tetratricopeptide repeat protein [Sphingomonas ginkgonis]